MEGLTRDHLEPASPSRPWTFAAVLTALFLVAQAAVATRHEFWRDEMQAWLIARDVPDLPALLEQAHYEGAPPLWSLLLRPVAWLTHRPEAMQVMTWLLAGATLFVLVRFAPLNRLQKILLTANYYLLFEYGTVCRNYLLGILGLTAACCFFGTAATRPWRFVLTLALAVFASVHSLTVAVAMAAGFIGEQRWLRRGPQTESGMKPARPRWLPWGFLAACIALSVYSMTPRDDTYYPSARGWGLVWNPARLADVCWALVSSHFALPRPPGYFWIPPWDTPFPSFAPPTAYLLAAGILGGAVLVLRRHAGALIFYLVGTFGVAAFLYIKYLGFSRHTAFLFFTFLFAWWIRKASGPSRATGGTVWFDRLATLALTAMLACQAVTGVWAVSTDWQRPFSCGKAAAQVLRDRGLENAFIAAGPDWAGAPVAGYLDRSLYYPGARKYGSYIRWDTQRAQHLEDEEFLLRAFKEARGRETVLVLDHRPAPAILARFQIETLAELRGSLTPFEDYYLFRVPPNAHVVN